jgi:hypothetical protein
MKPSRDPSGRPSKKPPPYCIYSLLPFHFILRLS